MLINLKLNINSTNSFSVKNEFYSFSNDCIKFIAIAIY